MNCNGLTKLQLTLSPATFYNEQGKAHESKACNEGGKNQNHEKRMVYKSQKNPKKPIGSFTLITQSFFKGLPILIAYLSLSIIFYLPWVGL